MEKLGLIAIKNHIENQEIIHAIIYHNNACTWVTNVKWTWYNKLEKPRKYGQGKCWTLCS